MTTSGKFDAVYTGFNAATMRAGRYHPIEHAAIAVRDGTIAWIGAEIELPDYSAASHINLGGGWVTPGLIDCHTHLVFGGNRAGEFEQRLQGASYQDIAAAGGGIAASVRATRKADEQTLIDSAGKRLQSLLADGVTTIEIKSGYGLDLPTELKMLRVARELGRRYPVRVTTTCLAAHALPPEYAGQADAYIDHVCEEILPVVAESDLADAVDGFCEGIAFNVAQIERYFDAARKLGLPVKLHAEQLSALGGSSLAARFGALSADHLEYASQEDVQSMADASSVAVLLPGAFYVLKETRKPPVEAFREAGVPMAVASDSNPGTSPALSLRLMMNMACTLFDLTPEEALAGVTCHAAQALGMQDSVGELSVGKFADFVCWDVQSPGELAYWMGGDVLKQRVCNGVTAGRWKMD